MLYPGMPTAIGSLPHKNINEAMEFVLKNLKDAPHWPQLQSLRFTEQMEVQPSEGIPGLVLDDENKKIFIDTKKDTTLEQADFFEKYMTACESLRYDDFAISSEYVEGIHYFHNYLKGNDVSASIGKLQMIGPFSFCFSLCDQDKKSILFNDFYMDICVKMLTMKALWQIELFKPYFQKILFFLDEPVLSAYGTIALQTISKEVVCEKLNEVIDAIKNGGAVCGTHCCGNTDWGMMMETNIDVLNFDAYNFGDKLVLYADKIEKFIKNGKFLAYGIVPTSDSVDNENVESLRDKLVNLVCDLASKTSLTKDEIFRQIIITPSCGTGTLNLGRANRVYRLLNDLSKIPEFLNGTNTC